MVDQSRTECHIEDNDYYHYEGEWSDDEPNGHGVQIWCDGLRYVGDFVNGCYEGKGVMDKPDGTHYEGDFYDCEFHGHGTCTYPSGIRYEGDFERGRPIGHGTVYFTDGTRLEGVFSRNVEFEHGADCDEVFGEGYHIDSEGNKQARFWVLYRYITDCTGECVEDKREYFRNRRNELF